MRTKNIPARFPWRKPTRWKTLRQLSLILAIMGGSGTSFAVQFVDVGLESPTYMQWATTISSGIVYDKIYEDSLVYNSISEQAGTNYLWISQSDGFKGTRSLAARCFAFDSLEKDRAEFRSVFWTQPYAPTFGQEMYYGYAMKIDADSSFPTHWMHIMQAWQGNCGPKVPITFSYDLTQNAQWKFNVDVRTLTTTTTIGSFVFNPGEWYKLEWRLAPSYPGFGGGAIDLWINDSPVVSWQGDWGIEPGTINGVYGEVVTNLDLRCGIYRGHQATEQTLLFDQIKYADSYYEADPSAEMDWGFSAGAEGWTIRQDVANFSASQNCINGDISGGDPGLYSPDNLNLDCAEISSIRIKMKNSSSGTQSAVFFTTDSSPGFSADKRLTAALVASDAGYTVYEFDPTANPAWMGTLKRLRFDPVDDGTATGSFSIDFIDLSSSHGVPFQWDGGANDSERWGTAANWNPDVAPNSEDDFVFTGNSISVLGGSIMAKSLTGGAGATLRVRNSGQSLTGNLVLTNSATLRFVEVGATTAGFSVNGSTLLGGTGFSFLVDDADDGLTLDFDTVVFSPSSTITKQGSGSLIFNATAFEANKSTLQIDEGSLTLGGLARYYGLAVDLPGAPASGQLIISNSITLKELTIEGSRIPFGTYPPGHAIYTTHAGRLVNTGGTLKIGISWDGGANDSLRWGTAANWDPDTAPNTEGNFVFTGTISVLSGSIAADALIGGAGSILRIRNSGKSLTGDLILTNSAKIRLIETGAVDVGFSVNGSTTLGNSEFYFLVDQADDDLTLNFDAVTFLESSTIKKQGEGRLAFNATSLAVNGNILAIDAGQLTLGGTANYSGLRIDVTGISASGKLVISNSVTLKGLTITGLDIAPGTYPPGDAIYTNRLINTGGTLTIDPNAEPIGYATWILDYPGVGTATNLNDNPDGDRLDNLGEWAMGGNPDNAYDVGYVPTVGFIEYSGDDWVEYVYARRTDYSELGLTYSTEHNTNLMDGVWMLVNPVDIVVGSPGLIDPNFDSVTNWVVTTGKDRLFIHLIIESN